jgi:NADPH-dependent 2,4-dienoyl-CoA reductase/sulfur reductase-like enzyme
LTYEQEVKLQKILSTISFAHVCTVPVEAVGVDVSQKVVQIKADSLLSQLSYDYLVLATGGQPRKLKIAGSQLNNILELRTPEDANRIAANAQGKTVVIVGSSFIGTEVAAFMAGKAASVTVICRTDYPLERSLGKEVGKYVQSLHEAKGVKFMPRADVEAFSATEENSSAVAFVHLVGKEETLKADLVVLGVGVVPATTFLKGSGVELNSSGNVEVNENLETSCPGVFAAGDIANFPLQLPTVGGDQRVAIGHWQIAQTHGRTVGLNLGLPDSEKSALKTVPFFWTVQYGKSLRYAGYAPNYDDIIYDGSVAEGSFVAYYCHEDSVLAVATLGRDPV